MARIPYVDLETASDTVRKTLDELPAQLNIFRMVANAETCFRPFLRLGAAILSQQHLDALLREHVILRVGHLWDGSYEFAQHIPIALACGASEEQISAHERGEIKTGCFNDCEQAVLQFVTETVKTGKPGDETFAATAAHLSPREIVELLLTIGFYTTVAMVTEATAIEIDEPVGTAVVDGLK
jgi:alkylhydroperoxidase family enzyme